MSKKLIAGLGVVAGLAVAMAPVATFATDYVNPRGHQDKLSVTIETTCAFGYKVGSTEVIPAGSHTNGTITGYNGTIQGDTAATQADTPTSGKAAGKGYGAWDNSGAFTAYDIPATGDPTVSTDTAYGIMENNTYNDDFAETTLKIVCNNENGYTLTATATDLTKASSTAKITTGGHTSSTADSKWSYKLAATDRTDLQEGDKGYGQTNAQTLKDASTSWSTALTGVETQLMTTTGSGSSEKNGPTASDGDWFTVTYGVGVNSTQAAGTYEGTITYILAQLN